MRGIPDGMLKNLGQDVFDPESHFQGEKRSPDSDELKKQ
jgi:hypothetical protein